MDASWAAALSAARVKIAGVAAQANGLWMSSPEISVTAWMVSPWEAYVIHERDPLFHRKVPRYALGGGNSVGETSAALSHLNAHAERFVRTIKESCLDRLILFGRPGCGRRSGSSWHITIRNGITKGLGPRCAHEQVSGAMMRLPIRQGKRLGGM